MRSGRHLALLLRIASARAHVPTYGGDKDNCFTPPHTHTVSQAVYLKGSGGMEIHIDSNTHPFDIEGGEILDVDAVFKREYDQTTYDLFIGCGGCVASTDALEEEAQVLEGYEPGVVEPFTQTAYRSVFKKADRKYNSARLVGCVDASSDPHFSIQIRDYHNRTEAGHETLVWAAVIGLSETFTAEELLSFPLFVLRNHGDTWNGLGWTWWAILPGTLLGIWICRHLARYWFGLAWLSPFDLQVILEPRAWLCEFAIVSFAAAQVEIAAHLGYAQAHAEWGYELAVGLLLVAGLANGLPILVQALIFWGLYHRDDEWVISSTSWWPLELFAGVSWLFLFGAGFYIGPAFVILDALFSAYECFSGWRAPRLDRIVRAAGNAPKGTYGAYASMQASPTKSKTLKGVRVSAKFSGGISPRRF